MTLYSLGDDTPQFADPASCWVAPTADVIGNVHIGKNVGIWFGTVIRGDNEPITIGDNTNIQEHSCLHTDPGFPIEIGEGCTIGHKAMIHGCKIGNNSLIGMGAIILNGAKIGNNCLVGAGALVTEGKEYPDGSMIIGSPAKLVRELDESTIAMLQLSAKHYVENQKRFSQELKKEN